MCGAASDGCGTASDGCGAVSSGRGEASGGCGGASGGCDAAGGFCSHLDRRGDRERRLDFDELDLSLSLGGGDSSSFS